MTPIFCLPCLLRTWSSALISKFVLIQSSTTKTWLQIVSLLPPLFHYQRLPFYIADFTRNTKTQFPKNHMTNQNIMMLVQAVEHFSKTYFTDWTLCGEIFVNTEIIPQYRSFGTVFWYGWTYVLNAAKAIFSVYIWFIFCKPTKISTHFILVKVH